MVKLLRRLQGGKAVTQYCRYCNNMICGDANWCSIKKKTFSDEKIKSPNKCKDFNFNPIDALSENTKGYKERPVKIKGTYLQIALFDEWGKK